MSDQNTIVIGSGPAGYVCAIRLAQLGEKVTLIEKSEVGGVCLNRGCIPSKALISAAHLYEKIKSASRMGIHTKEVSLNFKELMTWKQGVVHQLTQGVSNLLKANQVKTLFGEARFLSSHALEVTHNGTTQTISFKSCVIATGSSPSSLPFLKVDNHTILDSTSALSLDRLPESLICIGGGYIGLELGTFYAKLGSQVTVVEGSSSLLSGLDSDIHQVLLKRLKELKVKVLLNTQVQSAQSTKNHVMLQLKDEKLEAQACLVTVGRRPNTQNLNLAAANITLNKEGFIPINAQCQTSSPHIYAIGDVAGQPMLAHKGSAEAMVAAQSIAGEKTQWQHIAIPAVVFTDPEIASVGLTQTQAEKQNIDVDIATFPFAANGRALSMDAPIGFVKIISEKSPQKGKLLGVHIIGAESSQLISEAALALEMGAFIDDLALTIHPHPTLSEVIMEAAHVGLGHGVHLYKPPKAKK